MKKNIMWVTSILFILLLIFGCYLKINNKNKLSKQSNSGMFAIMLEKEKGTGKYDYAKDNKWPKSDEYVINIYKTYCEKGSILRWNNETKKINATVKGTDKCYVYFDLSEYGDEEHPYLIQTIEDLVRLSNDVNSGTTYAGKYFLLTTDLDFQDESDYENANRTDFKDINGINGDEALIKELTTGSGFKPIGNSKTKSFQGTFEGNNKTIDNLYINNTKNLTRLGLFGEINNSTFKSLTLKGNISSTTRSVMGSAIGGAEGTNSISNITSYIKITSESDEYDVGGIIGGNYGNTTIKNCQNYGELSGANNTGGIVGYSQSPLIIQESVNYGSITNNLGTSVGGLLGRDNTASLSTVSISNSHNEGKIISNTIEEKEISIGGLVGRIKEKIDIKNSYNTGEIRNERLTYSSNLNIELGGLIGYLTSSGSKSTIVNSYNTGNLSGATKVGGIIGYILNRTSETIIDKCYNKGNITSNIVAGNNNTSLSGLVGYGNNSKIYILNSYNTGNIASAKLSAGIGFVDFGGILYAINTYNLGNIVGNMAASGMFASGANKSNTNSDSNIFGYNSYNVGNINASRKGGVYVEQYNDTVQHMKTISNLYYENSVSASNVAGVEGSPMALNDMRVQTFVDSLNKNLESIHLSEIDESLKGYTLSQWTLGKDGYPTLVNE